MESVLKELVDSDERYVRQLKVLVNDYVSPLRRRDARWKRLLCDTKDIAVLFLYLDQITLLSSQFLDLLRSPLPTSTNGPAPSAFPASKNEPALSASKNGPALSARARHVLNTIQFFSLLFRLYAQYAGIYAEATKAIVGFAETNAELRGFLRDQEERGLVRMEALLITPIQRLPRYELLIKEMLKCVGGEQGIDIAEVKIHAESAIACVQKANEFVNDSIRQKEQRQRLLEIQRRFTDTSAVILGNGVDRVVKEGVIGVRQCATRAETELESVLAVLTPKHLILAQVMREQEQSLRLMAKLPVDQIHLPLQSKTSTRLLINHTNPNAEQLSELYFADQLGREEWLNAIKGVTADLAVSTALEPCSPPAATPKGSTLDCLLREVTASEKRYSAELELLVKCFVRPLLDAISCGNLGLVCADLRGRDKVAAARMLGQTDIHIVLHCLVQLHILHEGMAARFEELECSQKASVERCAKAFNALFPLLKLYDSYNARIDAFVELLQAPQITLLVAALQRNPLASGRNLREIVRLPLHRLQTYQAWICRLQTISRPPPASLESCLRALEQVSLHLSETRYHKRNTDKLVAIQSSLVRTNWQFFHRWLRAVFTKNSPTLLHYSGVPNLLDTAWREVLLEAEMFKVKRNGMERCRFWLFSDMLVYARRLRGDIFRFRRALPTRNCVAWVDGKGNNAQANLEAPKEVSYGLGSNNPYYIGNPTAFVIRSPDKAFVVICPTVHVRNAWVKKINSLYSAEAEDPQFAAVKFPLNWAPTCQKCGTKIRAKGAAKKMWMRHCNSCGAACCNACARKSKSNGQSRRNQCADCKEQGVEEKQQL